MMRDVIAPVLWRFCRRNYIPHQGGRLPGSAAGHPLCGEMQTIECKGLALIWVYTGARLSRKVAGTFSKFKSCQVKSSQVKSSQIRARTAACEA